MMRKLKDGKFHVGFGRSSSYSLQRAKIGEKRLAYNMRKLPHVIEFDFSMTWQSVIESSAYAEYGKLTQELFGGTPPRNTTGLVYCEEGDAFLLVMFHEGKKVATYEKCQIMYHM